MSEENITPEFDEFWDVEHPTIDPVSNYNRMLVLRKEFRTLALHNRELIARVREDYGRFARRVIVILSIFAIIQTVIGIEILKLLNEPQDRIAAIQEQRYAATFENCISSNERNDNTIAELDTQLGRLNPLQTPAQRLEAMKRSKQLTPAEKAQGAQERRFTILLINTLAPKRDCRTIANNAVR